MNIFYIVPYTPTLIRVRPYNLIRYLVRHGHRVTLATLWETPAERQALGGLKAQGIEIIAAPLSRVQQMWNATLTLPTRIPLQAAYCQTPKLRQTIAARLEGQEANGNKQEKTFDVVHVEHLRGAQYGLHIKAEIPVVWDSVDCISYLFEQAARQSQSAFSRLITWLELERTRRYEGWLVGQFDKVVVTSKIDKAALERLEISNLKSKIRKSRAEIAVLPNGVDLEYFAPCHEARQPETVVFSGKMSYHANVTAALYLAHQVMPLVWAQRPNVRLIIAGSRPSPAVRKLAETYPQVEVTGYLSDLRAPLRQASLAAAPLLYGAGIQNKVLEAMACGTPVVASPLAVSALQTQPGQDCLVANSPQTFAEAILTLLNDPALRGRVGTAGRRYVETHHDWNTIAAQLESIYQRSLENAHKELLR